MAARRFPDEARDAFAKLAEFPGMGAACEFQNPALAGLRFWPIRHFRNFLIFYRAVAGGIDVIRVLHGARDLERALSEPSE